MALEVVGSSPISHPSAHFENMLANVAELAYYGSALCKKDAFRTASLVGRAGDS